MAQKTLLKRRLTVLMVHFLVKLMKIFLRWLFFNLWYLRKPPWDTDISPPELIRYIQSHPPGRVLDLGSGTGTNAITLAQHGWQVTAVDFAHWAIKIARRKARKVGAKIDFLVRDVTTLDGVRGTFDLVLDIGCFHGLSQTGKTTYIHNLEWLLAPDGNYLMYGFFKDAPNKKTGLIDADIDALSSHLMLESREDGTERGIRPSAWFLFKAERTP
jgi:2-polyprenyl-3-methyl-5-hydroxy-6-metoxy-1,4-benzoquinol methylase